MFMFGMVTICQGLVRGYSGLLATRFFLGFFETGMFPGCKSHESKNAVMNISQTYILHLTNALRASQAST
jgi:hypothetical protein